MPLPLPNLLIHLSAIVRPRLLRPDIRVPSIAHVDFRALRKLGFNAVVIDKDNCLTLPQNDDLYPPLEEAWKELKRSFDPGRVLLVSNSAGTKKDPSGLAAECVTRSLRAPILLHPTPKPACAPLIIQYFRGQLGLPRTSQIAILDHAHHVQQEIHQALELTEEVMEWRAHFDGPLLGPPRQTFDKLGKAERPGSESFHRKSPPSSSLSHTTPVTGGEKATTDSTLPLSSESDTRGIIDAAEKRKFGEKKEEELKILVIGDRLFTDTLLAWRLSLLLPPSTLSSLPNVISIHTVSLPEVDQQLVRLLETILSLGKLKPTPPGINWEKFIRPTEDDLTLVERLYPSIKGISLVHFQRKMGRSMRTLWRWGLGAFGLIIRGLRWGWKSGKTGVTWGQREIKGRYEVRKGDESTSDISTEKRSPTMALVNDEATSGERGKGSNIRPHQPSGL
ncbi:hypothetical protein M231_06553 [Tremella mesenterica]|uniref:HAD phosphatase, family IIIA n=1 Tax=Tremella mesenterica TaxID=5217 RepID=A0A4Q1BBQ3_TREME|nr:uncharacterized protein TREMEDRAFT_58822 [Tremella mesenterica DSM 1558]EIW72653.1 hypothetical protein TREMEDRAFT_58822 [Tremella mesenterica DSM 1558]RXK36209.1 hypothetical protein M231_06553 [Tremella mesenterica]